MVRVTNLIPGCACNPTAWIKTVEYKHPGFDRPIKLENMCYKVGQPYQSNPFDPQRLRKRARFRFQPLRTLK
jgi:hypothetical protein